MADPILALEDLHKSYGTKVVTEVLHGIDLEIGPGEFTAIMGPSGSGKSTLLNLVGLLDRPTSGRVILDGEDAGKMDVNERTRFRGRKLGFIFQFHHLLPAFTALENVFMPLAVESAFTRGWMRERAAELLDAVGLSNRASYKATDLSGGQQQRVAVARALVTRPPLVLADEPTGNLDTESSDEVFELMRRFNREREIAFVIVTHDPRIADRCDRVVQLVDGRIDSDVRR